MGRFPEVRVEQDAYGLGEQVGVAVEGVDEFEVEAADGAAAAELAEVRAGAGAAVVSAHDPEAVAGQMAEGAAGARPARRAELGRQFVELSLGLGEADGGAAVGLVAAESVERQEGLVRGSLAVARPAAKLLDAFDLVHIQKGRGTGANQPVGVVKQGSLFRHCSVRDRKTAKRITRG